jgi:hypothetical protein
MFSDIVGYTALMGRDEEAAFNQLRMLYNVPLNYKMKFEKPIFH